ncbi:hypothetical protein PIB30_061468 [Stylosanthes scabra]|uniref:Uncharacterized protein n=1 Tax=Stylosanthes scabra TaxID=79078 RepID=A0ABU6VKD6_9FABA|nr:hypothetical protein [Stylosanthes scabra]
MALMQPHGYYVCPHVSLGTSRISHCLTRATARLLRASARMHGEDQSFNEEVFEALVRERIELQEAQKKMEEQLLLND